MTEAATIKIAITIDFGSAGKQGFEKAVTLTATSTVLDALTRAAAVVTSPKFGMDHFVEAIDGVENDFAADHSWQYEVNGYRSDVPAERYLLKDGDWIKWLYVGRS
jgi:hypothetical protein